MHVRRASCEGLVRVKQRSIKVVVLDINASCEFAFVFLMERIIPLIADENENYDYVFIFLHDTFNKERDCRNTDYF